MEFLIRKMAIGDIEAVYLLGISKKEFTSEGDSFWTREQLSRWCQSPSDVLIVAEQDQKIVGFSLYSAHVSTKKVTWENLYVVPSARKVGIASALSNEGLKQIKALGYKYVVSYINADDQDKFVSFARKFGFKKGNKVWWISQTLDADRDKQSS